MQFDGFHIAQVNIGLGLGVPTDPVMAGFVEQIDYMNSVAERSAGFVWRLKTEEGDATSIQLFGDERIIVNMSVWTSIEALYRYAFESDHRGPLRDRKKWFAKMDRPQSTLWWIPAGSIPDVSEVRTRLDLLRDEGPSVDAFTFRTLFDPWGRALDRPSAIERGCGV